jgi:transcriptional regulator with XRE-family HTH domain
MVTPNMTTTLHRIQRAAKRRRITLDRIAKEAAVTRQHVSHVLNGKFKSRRVVEITKRLIAEHDAAAAVSKAGTAA